jgi:hypothetical protein
MVRVVTKRPFPAGIGYLAGPLVIMPHEYYARVGPKGMNQKPLGSGLFQHPDDLKSTIQVVKNAIRWSRTDKVQNDV